MATSKHKRLAKTNSKLAIDSEKKDQTGILLENYRSQYDPYNIVDKAIEEAMQIKERGDSEGISTKSDLFKALTIHEFENGWLMTASVSEQYKTLSIQMSRQIQKEYDCKTTAEKGLAELIAISFCRILQTQSQLSDRLNRNEFSEMTFQAIEVFGKELERANRQYLGAVQTLKAMKQTPLTLNIKTNTAVVGQNQVVQANN